MAVVKTFKMKVAYVNITKNQREISDNNCDVMQMAAMSSGVF